MRVPHLRRVSDPGLLEKGARSHVSIGMLLLVVTLQGVFVFFHMFIKKLAYSSFRSELNGLEDVVVS
ncbi:hypothetical protein ACN38_g8627 [Penicillium nordicum]|uniref:Uncharacterized protein n=1 Tax=Penicillium nordicum TaxID=229535 RepID=A0A0M9WDA3_9EURO|nr:hypothetical protein ACN38_g8627 [Penicillium nordicum]